MDKLYSTYLVPDSRMKPVSQVEVPVALGSGDNNVVKYRANSTSVSGVSWSINTPSESVFLSRRLIVESNLQFSCRITQTAAGIVQDTNVFSPGQNVCLTAFPFHRICNQLSTQINNSLINLNMDSYLSPWLLMQNEDLDEWSTQCPTQADKYLNYTDCVSTTVPPAANPFNSPFNGYRGAYDKKNIPRGAYRINITKVDRIIGGAVQDASLKKALATNNITESWYIEYNVDVRECVICPPWQIGKSSAYASAFLGVSNINLNYNMNSNANRSISLALLGGPTVVNTLVGISANTFLYVQYLNSSSTELLPARCVYRFDSIYNYSTALSAIAASSEDSGAAFSSLSLSEIPRLIMIYARARTSTTNVCKSDSFLKISNLSISFNNRVSLLNSFSDSDLYLMSKKNGLGDVDYQQWQGETQVYDSDYDTGANAANGKIFLSCAPILIDPKRDLSISSAFLSNSSVGQFDLSFRATVKNNSLSAVEPELVILLFNSRLLTTASGQSEVQQIALNQEIVLKTIDDKIEKTDVSNEEYLGGANPMMSSVVNKGLGVSRSGGASRSGGKSKLDMLLM